MPANFTVVQQPVTNYNVNFATLQVGRHFSVCLWVTRTINFKIRQRVGLLALNSQSPSKLLPVGMWQLSTCGHSLGWRWRRRHRMRWSGPKIDAIGTGSNSELRVESTRYSSSTEYLLKSDRVSLMLRFRLRLWYIIGCSGLSSYTQCHWVEARMTNAIAASWPLGL